MAKKKTEPYPLREKQVYLCPILVMVFEILGKIRSNLNIRLIVIQHK
jgi:hypothetical protein